MNARVLLLVLATGFFMAIWNSDQSAMQAALVRRDHVRTAMSGPRSQHHGSATNQPPVRQSILASVPTATSFSREITVPLPNGIAEGVYYAVNRSGETARVTVSGDSTAGETAAGNRDLYVSDTPSGIRWYLIRIQPEVAL